MRVLHSVIAVVFVFLAGAMYWHSGGTKWTPTLLALVVANVSLTAISLELVIERVSGRGRPYG